MHIAQPVAYSFDSLSSNSMKSENPNSGCNEVDVSRSLDTSRGLDPSCNQGGIGIAQPVAVYENHPADSRIKDMGEVCSTVTSRWGTGGGNMPIVSQPIPIHDQATRHAGKNGDKTMGKGNGLGIGEPGDPMNTLTKGDHHAVAYAFDSLSSNSMKSKNPHSGCREVDLAKTIDTFDPNPSKNQGGIAVMQPIPLNSMNCFRSPEADPSTGCGIGEEGEAMFTITKTNSHAVAQPIAFEPGKLKRLGYGDAEPGLCPALRAEAGDNQVAVAQPVVLMDQGGGVMNIQTDGIVGTLRRETHGHEPVIMQPIPIDSMNHLGRSNENHSMGDFVPGAPSYTLTKGHSHAVAHQLPVCIGGEHPNAGIGIDQTPTLTSAMGTGGGHVPAVSQPIAFDTFNQTTSDVNQTIKSPVGGANESIGTVLTPSQTAWSMNLMSPGRQTREDDGVGALTQDAHRPTQGNEAVVIQQSMAVRRLTPMECERLQGFPDGYTNIPWRKAAESPDGPRYKALGNSWAVPVVAWIGKRIDAAIKEKKNG
jgi:hypothetical protein